MKYDIREHGIGVRVWNYKTNKHGVVKDIRETFYEWIDPFVLYDGEAEIIRADADDLEIKINKDENNGNKKAI